MKACALIKKNIYICRKIIVQLTIDAMNSVRAPITLLRIVHSSIVDVRMLNIKIKLNKFVFL